MKAKIVSARDKNAVSMAASVLGRGGIIIYPTESSYGIGADATSEKAVKRIIGLKGRENKPISIIVSSVKMARDYAQLNTDALRLAKRLMPGRITLVVEKKNLPDALSKDTIGFRIPSHEFSIDMLRKFKKPVTATSANKSGNPALYGIKDVARTFGDSADLIIDAGNLPGRKASTVYDVANNKILRKGPVSRKEIIDCLSNPRISSS